MKKIMRLKYFKLLIILLKNCHISITKTKSFKSKIKQFSITLKIMRKMKLIIFKPFKFSKIEWAQKIKKVNEKKIEIHSIKKNYKISINRS
jgi:hypothetical protein